MPYEGLCNQFFRNATRIATMICTVPFKKVSCCISSVHHYATNNSHEPKTSIAFIPVELCNQTRVTCTVCTPYGQNIYVRAQSTSQVLNTYRKVLLKLYCDSAVLIYALRGTCSLPTLSLYNQTKSLPLAT